MQLAKKRVILGAEWLLFAAAILFLVTCKPVIATPSNFTAIPIDIEPMQVVLEFKSNTSEALINDVAKALNASVKEFFPALNMVTLEVNAQGLNKAQNDTRIKRIEEDISYYVLEESVPWNVARVNPTLNNSSRGKGNAIKVAVIDTGIDYSNQDLAGSYESGIDLVNIDTDPMDDTGHGTAVAGIIASQVNNLGIIGVAPGVRLFAVKAFDSEGVGLLSQVLEGIDWAIGHQANIIVMSFGSDDNSTLLQEALRRAYDKGILLIAAAGNIQGYIDYPAAYEEVIAVSALDEENTLASFSGNGSRIELAAPGVSILSTSLLNEYKIRSGTSMAAPHVAGVAAVVWSENPILTNKDVRNILHTSAIDLGQRGRDNNYGFGLVQVPKASLQNLATQTEIDILKQRITLLEKKISALENQSLSIRASSLETRVSSLEQWKAIVQTTINSFKKQIAGIELNLSILWQQAKQIECFSDSGCKKPRSCISYKCVCPTTGNYCPAGKADICESDKVMRCQYNATSTCYDWKAIENCAPLKQCLAAKCVDKWECSSDSTCKTGNVCIDHKCAPRPKKTYNSFMECLMICRMAASSCSC